MSTETPVGWCLARAASHTAWGYLESAQRRSVPPANTTPPRTRPRGIEYGSGVVGFVATGYAARVGGAIVAELRVRRAAARSGDTKVTPDTPCRTIGTF
jgi:hypothetical protein